MKQFFKHTFLIKFIFITSIFFGVVILAAEFFLISETTSSALVSRFHLTAVTAFVLLIALTLTLISHYVLTPEKELRKEIQKAISGDLSIEIQLDDYGVLQKTEHTLREMKVSLRKKIAKLQFSRSYLKAVLLNMCDGVMVLDAEGKIMLVNEALKSTLGFQNKFLGKRPIELIRNVSVQNLASEVLNGGKEVLKKEVMILLPVERTFLVHATAIIRNKDIEGAVLVFHDRTMQKTYDRMRREFVANVSHELRTPISNIKGYVETLLEGAIYDMDNAEDFLRTVQSESDRLVNLIADLLDISCFESGRLELDLERCSLLEIINSVAKKFEEKCAKKRITFTKSFCPVSYVRADKDLIFQALFNLVDNAVKYTGPGGQIDVSVFTEADFIKVDVSDNGLGIPEGARERIFERFYRVDKARSRELGGTGLGLSIVKHIVQEHGGELRLDSSTGKGSVFSFTLPLAK